MRALTWIVSPWLATFVFWSVFGACVIDRPEPPEPAAARLVASWDPLACGPPHRVVIELEDDAGSTLDASAPCWVGSIELDAPRRGLYRGRIYAWVLDAPIRSVSTVSLAIDAPVVHWQLATPP